MRLTAWGPGEGLAQETGNLQACLSLQPPRGWRARERHLPQEDPPTSQVSCKPRTPFHTASEPFHEMFPLPGTPFLQRPACSLPPLLQVSAPMPPSQVGPPCLPAIRNCNPQPHTPFPNPFPAGSSHLHPHHHRTHCVYVTCLLPASSREDGVFIHPTHSSISTT